MALVVKNPPTNAGDARDVGLILGSEGSTIWNFSPFATLSWEIPLTKKPGGLQSMGLQRVGHD